jgi:tRNA(Ile)-lysidine synthase TilS/MesJ
MESLFTDQIEQEAIIRIQKFARIAKAMDLPISVGFSGGKDS